ncbi:MAG: DUF4178 domain-containing protein [Cytophagales bacterium]|nr:MAG: DUF4178 domain-containing protein [Cytophagales bacterium]
MFNWFKKKKEEKPNFLDVTNMRLNQMRKNGFVDYDLKTWQVTAVYEYDWGNNYFADEFQLVEAGETIYLYVEEDGGHLDCSIARKINVNEIDMEDGKDVIDHILDKEQPPRKVTYRGEVFIKEKESLGYFRDTADGPDDWSEFVTWTFNNKEGTKSLAIEQWGEQEFASSVSEPIDELMFSNFIMPQ